MDQEKQQELDAANKEFWNELCGSGLAQTIGITSHDAESLRKFDDAYLSYYPYLLPIVRPETMRGQKVLEIGLGYGTLGQRLAAHAGFYQGLDISEGPVRMMNHRLRLAGHNGEARQGSALEMPFEDASFDQVVSIGCFHHTGDTARCVRETLRVLRPGGRAVVMLYHRFSYRNWRRWPLRTIRALAGEFILNLSPPGATEEQKKAYDINSRHQAAPETQSFSVREVRRMFSGFSPVAVEKRNCDPARFASRETLLPIVGRFAGLDLYIQAVK
jgi:ubiquinone/menaquinone biosynthesis C-methylase UbiE